MELVKQVVKKLQPQKQRERERDREENRERERERLRTRQDFTWGWLVKVDANRFSLFTEAVREGIYD